MTREPRFCEACGTRLQGHARFWCIPCRERMSAQYVSAVDRLANA